MANEVQNVPSMFVYQRDGTPVVNARFFNKTLWYSTQNIADLFDTTTQNVDYHRKNIYSDGEMAENATSKDFLDVVNRGFRGQVEENVKYYNLDMVIAIGYKINSTLAKEFRIWATKVLHEYIEKGFALDDERFKRGDAFDKAYFRELRERIKDIRTSERMLYQQLKDIYALSADYNHDKMQTLIFFAKVQNKVHFAITGNTSAEIIYNRADSTKDNMNLQTWRNAPDGPITKQDIIWAKNYLTEPELNELRYIINMFLDFAEHKAMAEEPIFMKEWEQELNKFLVFHNKQVLDTAGKISRIEALKKACVEYGKFKMRLKEQEKANAELERVEDIRELEKILNDGAK